MKRARANEADASAHTQTNFIKRKRGEREVRALGEERRWVVKRINFFISRVIAGKCWTQAAVSPVRSFRNARSLWYACSVGRRILILPHLTLLSTHRGGTCCHLCRFYTTKTRKRTKIPPMSHRNSCQRLAVEEFATAVFETSQNDTTLHGTQPHPSSKRMCPFVSGRQQSKRAQMC